MHHDSSLAPFSFLAKLQATEWRELEAVAQSDRHRKKSYIFRAHELNNALYVLLEGRVKITRLSEHGRELIQWFCLPGEIFGLSEDSSSHHRGLYAQAITDTRLLCIRKADFEAYVHAHPRVSLLIIEQLASRLRTLGDMLLNVTSDDAHVRFIKLLHRLCECYGRRSGSGVSIDIYLTHQQLADMIGVCRQTVSSMVGQMKRRGIMTADRNGMLIHSPRLLQQMALKPDLFLEPETPAGMKS